MAVRGSQEKFALEFLSVIIKSWGRGGGEKTKLLKNAVKHKTNAF